MSVRRVLTGIVALVALAGCGSAGTNATTDLRRAAATTAAPTLPAETVPVTIARSASTSTTPPVPIATTSTTTSTVVATTLAPTTVEDPTAGLPVPAPVPPDPRGKEAVVPLGSIEIPKIDVSKIMYEGVTLTTLDRGPGHWPGTAMPGAVGNVVVGGHRTSHDKPFRYIDRLVAGDEVVFTTDSGRFVYAVTSTEVVTPDQVRIIEQTPERTATLFACTPLGSTSHRLVIHLALAA